VRAFVGVGSNLGDRRAHLRAAVAALPDVVAVSPVYETDPVGGPAQGPYLNCVVELATERSPHELLTVAHQIESAAGRVRAERWGPRPIDVDILVVGELEVDTPDLTVPHPRLWVRAFVLVPLRDLAPDLVAPETLARVDLAGVVPAGRLDD
jgi:2-amino-4-hydroxy-6-hydroxymethyldihydropteridine diphosphokinase